jgi:hypothetical protein
MIGLTALVLTPAVPRAQSQTASRSALSATVTVPANKPWVDSGISVKKGESLQFCASGEIVFSPDRVTSGPAGLGDPDPRTLPVSTLPVGALIGMVDGIRFPIGANSKPIKMIASGPLLVGVNDWNFRDNSGAFKVQVSRSLAPNPRPCLTPEGQ